jgi:SAM-dependent methyltransferase
MAADNSEQIAEWNGALGQRWLEMRKEIAPIVAPFGNAALKAAAPKPGERVIDVGCGYGDTSIEIAWIVGATGEVLGLDVSQPMLEFARSREAPTNCAKLVFREGDASEAKLPQDFDLLFSRFGVMFFSQPAAAFAHLRQSLRTGGRCVFVCWRTPRDNAWAMTPDGERVRTVLSDAGFKDIDMQRFDTALSLGTTPRAAAERAVQLGPASRLVREVGVEYLPVILEAIERALAPLAAPDGQVTLNGSCWIVSAMNRA